MTLEYNKDILGKLRKKKRLTYTELMFDLSRYGDYRVSRQTLINWERGNTSPNVHQLEMLAGFYSVSVGYFFSGGEDS